MYKFTMLIISAAVLITGMAQRGGPPATKPMSSEDTAAFQEIVRQHQQADFDSNRQKQVKKLQADLQSSNEEFAVLQPLIEKCLATGDIVRNFDYAAEFFGVGRSYITHAPNKDGSPPADPSPGKTPAWIALQDLDRMLHDPNTTDEQIKAQMQVVRQDWQQAEDDYAAACKELRALVTRRQEVVLFLNDVLD